MRFTAYAMLVACLVCVLQFLATHDARALVVPAPVYWLTFAMAIISTVIPAWLMSEGIRLTGANHAAMVGSVGPVATIFFGYWFLNEPITVIQITGAALVLAGVTLVSTKADIAPRKKNGRPRGAIFQKRKSSDSVAALTLNSSSLRGSGIL
jgi:drug/metabolite transporter (DMT)-like permease